MTKLSIEKQQISKIKVIVCDLDGTLLNHRKQITEATAQYLIQLQEAGYRLVLASGRFYYELTGYIEQLKMKKFDGYAICANGLEIHRVKDDTMQSFDYLSETEIQDILSYTRNMHITAYANIHQIYHAVCNPWLYYATKAGTFLSKPFSKSNFYPFRLLRETDFQKHQTKTNWPVLAKICFFSSHYKLERFKQTIQHDFPHQYNFYYINRFAIEIVKSNVGKCYAVEHLCKSLSLDLSNVLFFGDSGNDEELLASAGIGITMKNGFYQTKRKARILSYKTNQQEGVLDMLEKLELFDQSN
ncbi:HAD-IIB family hydrolase [Absiella sp. AM54-8XD]|jgi:5-amino-6-(5-phospho-D-ribitylamino)uracil phosphatase|uniref:HAD-IIB family hydrolase n=2 Tax=Amedibacillus TaxID=2749846 RepID=A0A7G9GRK5_9FIRM|nr:MULTISPECIES: HAD-IIB family hydrolase [Bacillota]QNM13437.1 HAD-IIB family hydrolase [[Eubacterium] hominis]MCH4286964.1 HAD-IIB family hydrolase [Amedibacillus hominis]RGB49339.1 HAD-IIB family hydrolase [Absiella sp. AM22-9]RGB53902.1 HAD-IIB family hydrolase [Absiella sp. AM10-20]RGC19786.1 HAD-IIB family hydrolase [Absiella sp. AM54-8XD]